MSVKVKIKKQIEEYIEIEMPFYVDSIVSVIRVSEEEIITVYKDSIHTLNRPDESDIQRYYNYKQKSNHEAFMKEYNQTINYLTNLKDRL